MLDSPFSGLLNQLHSECIPLIKLYEIPAIAINEQQALSL